MIGGYTVGGRHFDALIFGYSEGDRLMYAARTRSGFTPAVREQLHQRFRGLQVPECLFANLPEARAGRSGEGLTATKMKDGRWLKPVLVGQFEFVEWTPEMRHSRFVLSVSESCSAKCDEKLKDPGRRSPALGDLRGLCIRCGTWKPETIRRCRRPGVGVSSRRRDRRATRKHQDNPEGAHGPQ